jgi:hypothetical protein
MRVAWFGVLGDIGYEMLIRPHPRVCARMPSTRSQPLNPRVSGMPPAVARPPAAAPKIAQAAAPDAQMLAEEAAREGGFHESSYELKNGLEVSESEWPPETTVPGALGRR